MDQLTQDAAVALYQLANKLGPLPGFDPQRILRQLENAGYKPDTWQHLVPKECEGLMVGQPRRDTKQSVRSIISGERWR